MKQFRLLIWIFILAIVACGCVAELGNAKESSSTSSLINTTVPMQTTTVVPQTTVPQESGRFSYETRIWKNMHTSLRVISTYDAWLSVENDETENAYNSDFFQENSLILIGFFEGSQGYTYHVNRVEMTDGVCQVFVDRIEPCGGEELVDYQTLCVELGVRLESSTPLEICIRDHRALLEGTTVFTGITHIRALNMPQLSQENTQQLIRSAGELSALLGDRGEEYSQYDDTYFVGRSLMVICCAEEKGPYIHWVNSCAKEDGTSRIEVRQIVPKTQATEFSHSVILVEIDRVVQNEADITVEYIQLPL